MFEGAVGSCDVVGIQDGLHIGGGATLLVLAHVTLGKEPGIGNLGFGMVGNHGHGTLGEGVSVASGFVVLWWRVGSRISHSF